MKKEKIMSIVSATIIIAFGIILSYKMTLTASGENENRVIQTEVPIVTEEPKEFDINTDYSLLIAQAVSKGDSTSGKEYERLRNLKKEYIQIADNLNYDNLMLLAKIVQAEAGSNWLTEEHRQLVASVVMNRVSSPEFPNTIHDVIYQRGQYAPVRTGYFQNLIPSEKAINSALYVLLNGSIAPPSVVFQANFKQGSGVYKSIKDRTLGTTYFCYSSNRKLY